MEEKRIMSQTSSNPTFRAFKEKLLWTGDLGQYPVRYRDPLFTQVHTDIAAGLQDFTAGSFSDRQNFYRIYRYGYRHYARLAA